MKVFLIVGGSKGLGKKIIFNLAKKKKTHIIFLSRNTIPNLARNITFIYTDLSDLKSLKKSVDKIKNELNFKLDAIIFTHRYRPKKNFYNIEEAFKTEIISVQYIIDNLKEHFKKNGKRSIVITGSISTHFIALEQSLGYHIMKASLFALVKYYSIKLSEYNIRINMISPGIFLKEENRSYYDKNLELYNKLSTINPLNRIADTDAIFDILEFLLSKKSLLINGQNILIDGGITLISQESIIKLEGINYAYE